jgi:PQQ-like domain
VYALNASTSQVNSNGVGKCVPTSSNPVAPGGILWSYTGDASTIYLDIITAAPYVDYAHSAVWVTSHAGGATNHPSLWMFDPTNGQLKGGGTNTWNLNDSDSAPTPSLYDGSYIYVGTNQVGATAAHLYAINVSTRSLIGPYTPATGSGSVVGLPWPLGFSPVSPGSPDQIIFTQGTYVQSVCFTGTQFLTTCGAPAPSWTTQLTGTPTVSAPVDDGAGHLYIGGSDGKVHELDVATGTDHTSTNPSIPGAPTVGAPAFDVNLNRIYVGASDGHIYSFTTPW